MAYYAIPVIFICSVVYLLCSAELEQIYSEGEQASKNAFRQNTCELGCAALGKDITLLVVQGDSCVCSNDKVLHFNPLGCWQ